MVGKARQAVDGPAAAAFACSIFQHHCATGVWLYGLSVGLAHVLLTTTRCHLLQSAASATSYTAWSLVQCCMPRAGRALHFPVVQRQRIYRLKLVVLPGQHRPEPCISHHNMSCQDAAACRVDRCKPNRCNILGQAIKQPQDGGTCRQPGRAHAACRTWHMLCPHCCMQPSALQLRPQQWSAARLEQLWPASCRLLCTGLCWVQGAIEACFF